jgi:cell division GTPase FtsZ
MNLKEEFNEKFFNDLVKCDFLKDVEEIISSNGGINIDLNDFKSFSKGEIIGSISQCLNNLDEEYIINKISDNLPTVCIFNISSSHPLRLDDEERLLQRLRGLYPNIEIIFGTNLNKDVNIKVQALLIKK